MLRDRLDGHAVHQRTGCILHPSYLPAKILWLHRDSPRLAGQAGAYVSFAQYCTLNWLGSAATSVSMASGTGLFNHESCGWDEELTSALGVEPAALGEFVDDPELLPPVTTEYAARWPVLAGVRWRAPIGDGAASNVGSGCVTGDLLALMVGTSGALRRCSVDEAGSDAVPNGLWRYRLDRKHALTGGALSDGGNVYEWLTETFRLPDEATVEQELATRDPGQHGLVVLPFWSGERSLGWVGDATAMVAGLKHHTTPLDIFQAALEAITYRFAALYDALKRGGETIVASGGGLRESPAWLQMMADVFGQPLIASSASEASLRGSALVALRDAGAIDVLPRPDGGQVFAPRADRHERHLAARRLQQTLYDREVGPRGVNLLARQTRG
jgi:gluconokinase